MSFQPEVVNVGGVEVMAFESMQQLVNFIVHDDGSVFAGAAVAFAAASTTQQFALLALLHGVAGVAAGAAGASAAVACGLRACSRVSNVLPAGGVSEYWVTPLASFHL